MCSGGRLLADFLAGGLDEPKVPEAVQRCVDADRRREWVVWARKVAPRGDAGSVHADDPALFLPGRRGRRMPLAAVVGEFRMTRPARLHVRFPFLSDPLPSGRGPLSFLGGGLLHLDVARSGRVLAFEWQGGGVLFRAARQTVIGSRVRSDPGRGRRRTRVAGWQSIARDHPSGAGPVRLRLPQSTPQW